MQTDVRPTGRRLGRRLLALAAIWIVLVGLPSFDVVRAGLIRPLYLDDANARGDVAYVMADGYAYLERLRAAADLYHMHRIKQIYVLEEDGSAGYDFVSKKSQTKTGWARKYLRFLGVPESEVFTVRAAESAFMGSLSEAQAMSDILANSNQSLVVVTSAPHTRRSLLCFTRSLPKGVRCTVCAASAPRQSAELSAPIWLEYVKLGIYLIIA